VSALGKDLTHGIENLHHSSVGEVRGSGLLLGIGLAGVTATAVAAAAEKAGYLVNPVRPDTVRLAPPLILDQEQATGFVGALPSILDEAGQ
jgi:acetylornithine aminotransferase